MPELLLLDAYCKAGGASAGYARAGWTVVGVDKEPQPRYPFEFHRGDALDFIRRHGPEFTAVAASPPCTDHSRLRTVRREPHGSGWMLQATVDLLAELGRPYIVENVVGAGLPHAVVLCGSMFGLGAECRDGWRQLQRHRLFASNTPLHAPRACRHAGRVVGVYGGGPSPRYDKRTRGGYQGTAAERSQAMRIGWMTRDELGQAIPPAYTEHLGQQLAHWLSTGQPAPGHQESLW